MLIAAVIVAAIFLAYANGANDNFKGVATLYGSFTANYRVSLWLGTIATFAGSISALFIASGLIKMFSGSGVVPADVAAAPAFAASVAAAAAATVLVATRLGLPISTTHALTGAIIGAGLVSVGTELDLGFLGRSFLLPLLSSPVLAVALAIPLYYVLHRLAQQTGLKRDTCICLDGSKLLPVRDLRIAAADASHFAIATLEPDGRIVTVASMRQCVEKYNGRVLGISARSLTDGVHFLSAAAVSYARGLNDTPKLLGLLLVVDLFDIRGGVLAVAVFMALGGLINARRVAVTMSRKISRMNDGQALTANLVTAFLVIVASRMGLPVSTTQVSVGAITGVGVVNRSADKGMVGTILASWLLTLPVSFALAVCANLLLRGMA
ncbi:MAG TPA: inorganic phosphate transporter [Allosphingosinicella sp.]|nr:inorganic phosphate transporter [Allosphingosinicella sp.]